MFYYIQKNSYSFFMQPIDHLARADVNYVQDYHQFFISDKFSLLILEGDLAIHSQSDLSLIKLNGGVMIAKSIHVVSGNGTVQFGGTDVDPLTIIVMDKVHIQGACTNTQHFRVIKMNQNDFNNLKSKYRSEYQ